MTDPNTLKTQLAEARAARAVQKAAADGFAAEADRLEAEAEAASHDRPGAGVRYEALIHAAEAGLARDNALCAVAEAGPEIGRLEQLLGVAPGVVR